MEKTGLYSNILIMITVAEQLKSLDLEINRRKRVYPKLVLENKLSKGKADHEIKVMEAIKNTLILIPIETALIKL